MAETADRRIGTHPVADGTSPSTAEVKAAIRATRLRLAARLAETAQHVHAVFADPSSAQAATRDGSFIGGVIKTVAVAGRTTRAWSDARRTGILGRAAVGIATVAIAAAFVARTRRG